MEVIPGELIYYAQSLSPSFKSLLLVPTSDIHYGNALFSKRHLQRHIEFIKNTPNCFTFLNGDLCECVIKSSKGEIYSQKLSPQQQRDDMIEMLIPIKNKVLGCVTGNHERRIQGETSLDISEDIAKALGVPYRPEGMLLKISFGKGNNHMAIRPYTYWGYFTHGYGGARTSSAKAVKAERTSTFLHADFYCMSHDHVVNAAPVVYLMPDPRHHEAQNGFEVGKIKAVRKILVKSNAFVKWGGYAESGGFPPSDLETPIIKLCGTGQPKVSVEI